MDRELLYIEWENFFPPTATTAATATATTTNNNNNKQEQQQMMMMMMMMMNSFSSLSLSLCLSLLFSFLSLSLSLSLSFSSLISVSLFILPLTYLLFENVVWLKPSSSGSRCITWWASHRIWFLEGMPPKTVQTAQELEDKYGSGITKRGVSIKGSYI